MTTEEINSDFHSRQEYFCPVENINKLKILVVGCGAIGRNVASQVGRLGVGEITLVDGDHVEQHNIVPQNWKHKHCGKSKVEVLAAEIAEQMASIILHPKVGKWTPKLVGLGEEYNAVWSTVDDIDVRKILYNYYKDKCDHFFDVRIGGPMAQIITVKDIKESGDWYEKTIFDPSERADFGCVQPMSNFLANIASGISVGEFVKIYGGKSWPVAKMLTYCSISSTIQKVDPSEYFTAMESEN